MSYYKDVNILVYVPRGAYTVVQTNRNVEKFNMLRVLMATAFRDMDSAIRTLSWHAQLHWHEDRGALHIDMPNARWEHHFHEVQVVERALDELSHEHGYCVEHAVATPDDPRSCRIFSSPNVRNRLLAFDVQTRILL